MRSRRLPLKAARDAGGARWPRRPRQRTVAVRRPCVVLPRGRDADAFERFRHQDRSLAAGSRLERRSSRRSATADGAGSISYPAAWRGHRAAATRRASTDTGHTGNSAAFALGHPEKVIDMGYRAVHEMTGAGQGDRRRVSTARRRAFRCFNGLLAGRTPGGHRGRSGIRPTSTRSSPVRRLGQRMRLHAARVAINQYANRTASSAHSFRKFQAIHNAVMNECDATDGVKDGVIEDPTTCRFDPKVLRVQGRRRPELPDRRAGRYRARPLRAGQESEIGRDHPASAASAGFELGWVHAGRCRNRSATRRSRSSSCVFNDPSWNWRHVQCRNRPRCASSRKTTMRSWPDRSEPEAVLRSRRQAADVSRLERSAGVRR